MVLLSWNLARLIIRSITSSIYTSLGIVRDVMTFNADKAASKLHVTLSIVNSRHNSSSWASSYKRSYMSKTLLLKLIWMGSNILNYSRNVNFIWSLQLNYWEQLIFLSIVDDTTLFSEYAKDKCMQNKIVIFILKQCFRLMVFKRFFFIHEILSALITELIWNQCLLI